jgi:hypothetical protein
MAERGGFEPSRPFISCMLLRFHAHFPSPERNSRRQKRGSPKSSTSRSGAQQGRFRRLAVARETSNVCVHPEKERVRMKCLLSDIESLSAQIENLGNLGREQLDQTWRDLFGSDRPRRVCALGYRLQEMAIGGLKPSTVSGERDSALGLVSFARRHHRALQDCRSIKRQRRSASSSGEAYSRMSEETPGTAAALTRTTSGEPSTTADKPAAGRQRAVCLLLGCFGFQ